MKKLFTILLCIIASTGLLAQERLHPPTNLYPEDAFRYDQVLPAYQTPDYYYECENNLIEVMFASDSKVRLRDGKLIDYAANSTDGLVLVLDKLTTFEWQRFSDVPEDLLDQLSENGTHNTGQSVYNLNNIYRLRIPEQENIWEISETLENLPGIIYARPVPKPMRLPNPPSYQDLQGYLDPSVNSPSGIDAEYAWTRTGGTGTGITICDLEYAWNYNHADITKAVGSQINTNVSNPFSDNHHGTAVIGELVSNNNGWGTTGIAYNSGLKTCGTYYGSPSPSWNVAGAIAVAISKLTAGDIILLEQQWDYTGSDGFVPVEWWGNTSPNAQTNNPVYAAIVNAVAAGIHVVQAGGNGNVNTGNLTWYGNSGAVIVGAGGGYAANNLRKLGFSSYGSRFDVQGWGENVMTTGYGSTYSIEGINYYYTSGFNGTSSASPIVSGAIACFEGYWKANVSGTPPTPANMRAILKRHGRPQVNPADGLIGTRPNLQAMITGYNYCAASGTTCDEYISRVQFGSIDNSSACNSYVDYTTIHATNLALNATQTITVTNGVPYASDQCGIWVDWNKDGDFFDANESITVTGTPGGGPYTANITPSASASLGSVRMRIRITYTGAVDPCGTTQYGEVEDYTINLTAKVPNYWTGAFNSYWHNAGNWSLGHIPTSDEDVYITSAGNQPVRVDFYNEACNNLFVESGELLINGYTLDVNGNMSITGKLSMDNASGILNVMGNVNWNSGSTASFTGNSVFRIYGSYWIFNAGSNVQLENGVVTSPGSSTTYIRNFSALSQFNLLGSYKTGGAEFSISGLTNSQLTIKGYLYVHPGAAFGMYSSTNLIIKGDILSNGVFTCDYGTIILDGTSQSLLMNTNNYFNNLTFSSTGTVSVNAGLSSIIDVNGDILIESGVFNLDTKTIYVGGNWTNTAGLAAFTEGTSRVVFNSTGHNVIKTSETFNIIEANMGAALRVDNAASVVTCNQYDWTTGGIDVVAGTFTALDLYDNGIYGGYWLNPGGIINLTNDAWIDLNGNLNIYGGTFNVFGGSVNSDWPYSANASITMSDGVLDFKNRGIRVYSTATFTLTENITGGTIRTVGNFENQRSDFTPTGNNIEMYGTTDAYLTTDIGCSVYNVVINKGATDDEGTEFMELPDREGKPIHQTRASTAFAGSSPVTILGNLTMNSGIFDMNGKTVNVTGTVEIKSATLKMTSSLDNLSAYFIKWSSGSNSNVTNGVFNAFIWDFIDGTNAQLGTGNTAYLKDCYFQTDDDASFGNLVVKPFSKTIEVDNVKTYYPFRVSGNLLFQSGALWTLPNGMIVGGNANLESGSTIYLSDGDLSVAGSLILAGNLHFTAASEAIISGEFIFVNTGLLNVGAGFFTNTYNIGAASLGGTLQLTSGIVEFPNRSVSIGTSFNDQISGGTIKVGRTLAANTAGTFEPTGGTVEFVNASSGNYVQVTNGNYIFNMTLNKPGSIFQVYDNLVIKGSLNINAGTLNSNNKTITIAGDWMNNVGPAAFDETNGRVIFNGSGTQFCSTENFYILEVNKPGHLFNLSGSTINCQVYDWTNGGLWISPGNFSAADLADNGLYGDFAIYNGTMDLHQDAAQYADLNGNVIVGSNGTLNVYGGDGLSWWPYQSNASLTMNGGVLDFKDNGIYVNNSALYTFTENITGGTIKTSGSFISANANFTPTGGTVELYGVSDVNLSSTAGSYFNHLTINKSGGVKDYEPVNYSSRDIRFIKSSRGNEVILFDDAVVNGTLAVNAGKLSTGLSGFDLTCNGPVNISNGASMELQAISILKLNNSLTVNSGGTFLSAGSEAYTTITRAASTPYTFNVQSGGNFGANNTIFEYMGANGINIASGAIVEPSMAFNNCTFRNGLSANTLLTINSSQDLICTGANFPANTWGGSKNVTKSVNSGYMTFSAYTGAFGGAAFESDPNNRIEWYTTAPTHSVSIPAGWSGLSSYIMPSETNLPTLFSPIAANFTILQTFSGIYYPASSTNTIGPWASKSAYSVKMNTASTLPLSGLPEHDKVFSLASGWNLMPVICNSNVTTSTLVSGLGANLQIIKEVAGTKVYWPAYGIYTLSQLTPGKAYFVRMAAGGAVTFPNNIADNSIIPDEPIRELVTPWNAINRTAASHIIGIDAVAMNDILEGDILGVFTTTGLCVGNSLIENTTENHSLYAFADDQLTAETDGFTDGQTMTFKLFRPSTGEEFDLEVVYNPEMPNSDGLFATEGISAIRSISSINTGINQNFAIGLYIYPNPTNGKITIGGIAGIEKVLVMTSEGFVVLNYAPKYDGDQVLDLSTLPAGFYQVQIITSQGVVTRKVVKGM